MTANKHSSDQAETSTDYEKHPLAITHVEAQNGGHWWDYFDADEPGWHQDKHSSVNNQSDGNALRSEVAPDPPDTVNWDDYAAYNCVICKENCLNRRDSEAGEKRQCWNCTSVPDLQGDSNG